MNKTDIAALKKEFKLDSISLKIDNLYSVYLKKDNKVIIHSEFSYFEQLDIEKQELLLNNFKKVLTGAIDTKLFELSFDANVTENNCQNLLYSALETADKEAWCSYMDTMVSRVSESFNYDTDVVINFIMARFFKASKNNEDIIEPFQFILCTINKIDQPKKALKFDYSLGEFSSNSSLECIINLSSPLDGFTFPALSNGYSDVNKILYYSSKSKTLNSDLVCGVLNCLPAMTAEEEKESFKEILRTAVGDKVTPNVIQNIYETLQCITDTSEEDETPVIGIKEIAATLNQSGVDDVENLEGAFEMTLGSKDFSFKVDNIIPDFKTKSVKIENPYINVSINPKDLGLVKQVRDKNGNKCLLIQLTEDVVFDEFILKTEEEF